MLQHEHCILTGFDQTYYTELFAPYLKEHTGQYIYHLKVDEMDMHLQRIGLDMHRLLNYGSQSTYAILASMFVEHFYTAAKLLEVKPSSELSLPACTRPMTWKRITAKRTGMLCAAMRST